mgnify:CR=1 FL=1
MKKVSVIVPVYNGAKFIKKCLDCLINQTYQNVEIISWTYVNSDSPFSYTLRYPPITISLLSATSISTCNKNIFIYILKDII